jgi:hypothetical protein
MAWNSGDADLRRNRGDIGAGLFRKRPAAVQIVFVSAGPSIIGRQKAASAIEVPHVAEIGRARARILLRGA